VEHWRFLLPLTFSRRSFIDGISPVYPSWALSEFYGFARPLLLLLLRLLPLLRLPLLRLLPLRLLLLRLLLLLLLLCAAAATSVAAALLLRDPKAQDRVHRPSCQKHNIKFTGLG